MRPKGRYGDPHEGFFSFSADRVEAELVRLEAIKAQVTAVQARLVAEADRMQLPLSDGARTLPDWVSARLDITHDNASGLVNLARTNDLADLESGARTLDRVLARHRLTEAGATVETLASSDGLDLAGVRRLAARHRRLTRVDEQAAFARRHLSFQDALDGSLTRVWGELAGADSAVVRNALEEVGDALPEGPGGRGSVAQRNADALVALCLGEAESAGVTAVVTIDGSMAAATNGEAGVAVLSGPRLGPQALEEIMCEGTVEVTAVTVDGTAYGVGTAGKAIPSRVRRFVMVRDGGCVADGCHSRYRLQVHHTRVPRARGGTAEPSNLATFCWFHHHVVIHGRGFVPNPDSPPQRVRFVSPNRAPP